MVDEFSQRNMLWLQERMVREVGGVLARWDTQEELANMKQDMLDSGRFTKYKVKAMIITKNEIK